MSAEETTRIIQRGAYEGAAYPLSDANERMAVAIVRLLRARGSVRDRRHDMCELRRCLVRLTGSETFYSAWDRIFRAALACEHEINGQ